MKHRVAAYISNIFNPFLLGLVVIPLFSFKETDSTLEALKWIGISIALSILPALVIIIYLVHKNRLDGVFDNPRRQRYTVYLLAAILGALGLAIMWLTHAPQILRATFLAGFLAILVFMMVNFFWKISLHTAFMSASATVLTLIFGAFGALTLLVLPAVAWSRIELHQHTVGQVTAGAVCAAGISVGVFWFSGYL